MYFNHALGDPSFTEYEAAVNHAESVIDHSSIMNASGVALAKSFLAFHDIYGEEFSRILRQRFWVKTVSGAVLKVAASEDNTGCTSDLTVVSKAALVDLFQATDEMISV